MGRPSRKLRIVSTAISACAFAIRASRSVSTAGAVAGVVLGCAITVLVSNTRMSKLCRVVRAGDRLGVPYVQLEFLHTKTHTGTGVPQTL